MDTAWDEFKNRAQVLRSAKTTDDSSPLSSSLFKLLSTSDISFHLTSRARVSTLYVAGVVVTLVAFRMVVGEAGRHNKEKDMLTGACSRAVRRSKTFAYESVEAFKTEKMFKNAL